MKKAILCGIILSLSFAIFAQPTFSLRYGPDARVLSNAYPTDSCIYALGIALDSINPNSQGNIFLKLDLEGNVISTRVLTNPYKPYAVWKPTRDLDTGRFIGNAFYRILDVGSGYVAAGANADQELPSGMDGVLHKISYDGERIWERKYYLVENVTHFASHEFYDMRQTPDNGFIMAGQIVDYSQSENFQQGWIVKVDEYGCLVPGCHLADATIELTNNQPVIQLYPNPTTDFLNIYFKNPNHSKDEVFRLIDLLGRVVVEFDADKNDTTYLVSLEKYASGIYFLQYIQEGILMKSEKVVITK